MNLQGVCKCGRLKVVVIDLFDVFLLEVFFMYFLSFSPLTKNK